MKPAVLSILLVFSSVASAAGDVGSHQLFFEKHCVQCHGKEQQKGDVRLDDVTKIDTGLWKNIYEQLAGEEMPPDDQPQPTATERRELMSRALQLAKEGSSVAATGFRRLNQREYGNTVRDLLGLRKGTFDPGEYIYKDEVSDGFDTEAQSLVISNELLLEYMGSAEKSLRQALFSADVEKPASQVVEVKPAKMKGTSSRYINNHHDYVICRSGGNAMLFDGEPSRTMIYPGRYTITVTASGVDRDRYPVRFAPEEARLSWASESCPTVSRVFRAPASCRRPSN